MIFLLYFSYNFYSYHTYNDSSKENKEKLFCDNSLSAARRNIADARVTEISAENRFDAAYKAIMQLANAALQANGFRTLTSKPGHHMTMIQTLSQTIGVDKRTVIVLDALRKQRNVAGYSGDVVPMSAVEECLSHAEVLLKSVIDWLKVNQPEWLGDQE